MDEKGKKEGEFLTKEELIEFGKFLMIFDPELKKLDSTVASVATSYRNVDKYPEENKEEKEDAKDRKR